VIFIRSRDWPAFVNWVNALPPNGTEHLRELGAESWCCDPDGLKKELSKHLAKMPATARAFAKALLDWQKTQPKDLDVIVVQGGNRKSPRVVRDDKPRIEINETNLFLAVIAAGNLAVDAQTLVIQAATEARSGRTKEAERLLKAVRIKAYDTWNVLSRIGKLCEKAGVEGEVPLLLDDGFKRVANVWKVMGKVRARVEELSQL
jgi:hypothetical protein